MGGIRKCHCVEQDTRLLPVAEEWKGSRVFVSAKRSSCGFAPMVDVMVIFFPPQTLRETFNRLKRMGDKMQNAASQHTWRNGRPCRTQRSSAPHAGASDSCNRERRTCTLTLRVFVTMETIDRRSCTRGAKRGVQGGHTCG